MATTTSTYWYSLHNFTANSSTSNYSGATSSFGLSTNQSYIVRGLQGAQGGPDASVYPLLIVCFLATIENLFTSYIIYTNKILRTATNVFVFSLCVADMLCAGVLVPVAAFYKESLLYGYLAAIIVFTYAANLMAVTYERLISITKPLRYQSIMTKRVAFRIALAAWVIPTCFCLLPLIWGANPVRVEHKVFIIIGLVVFLVSPFFFICFVYARILIEVHRLLKGSRYRPAASFNKDKRPKPTIAKRLKKTFRFRARSANNNHHCTGDPISPIFKREKRFRQDTLDRTLSLELSTMDLPSTLCHCLLNNENGVVRSSYLDGELAGATAAAQALSQGAALNSKDNGSERVANKNLGAIAKTQAIDHDLEQEESKDMNNHGEVPNIKNNNPDHHIEGTENRPNHSAEICDQKAEIIVREPASFFADHSQDPRTTNENSKLISAASENVALPVDVNEATGKYEMLQRATDNGQQKLASDSNGMKNVAIYTVNDKLENRPRPNGNGSSKANNFCKSEEIVHEKIVLITAASDSTNIKTEDRRVKKRSLLKRMRSLYSKDSQDSSRDGFCPRRNRQAKLRAILDEVRASTAFAAVAFTYMFTWIPVIYMTFMEAIGQMNRVPVKAISDMNIWTIALNAALDPIFYALILRNFRKVIKKQFKKIRRKFS